MSRPVPHVVEAGAGPAVVCIHANASTSSQWRVLLERLSDRYRVVAPDSYGSGRSPGWPEGAEGTLAEEVEFLDAVLDGAGGPVHLVGHSYGGGVALKAALARPARVCSLALFEPTLFTLLRQRDPRDPVLAEARAVADAAIAAAARGDLDASARGFVDYWMGRGAWMATPVTRRAPVAASMASVPLWANALFFEPTPIEAFAALGVPVLVMMGSRSPRPARAIAEMLVAALPRVELVELDDVGHMGPVTHPELVADAIEEHLSRC